MLLCRGDSVQVRARVAARNRAVPLRSMSTPLESPSSVRLQPGCPRSSIKPTRGAAKVPPPPTLPRTKSLVHLQLDWLFVLTAWSSVLSPARAGACPAGSFMAQQAAMPAVPGALGAPAVQTPHSALKKFLKDCTAGTVGVLVWVGFTASAPAPPRPALCAHKSLVTTTLAGVVTAGGVAVTLVGHPFGACLRYCVLLHFVANPRGPGPALQAPVRTQCACTVRVTHPARPCPRLADTVKVRLQTQSMAAPVYCESARWAPPSQPA